MTDDLVTRLRAEANWLGISRTGHPALYDEAADEIERLREERDHLLHPSQGEVVTYQSRIDELAAALQRVSEERDRYREHSITLNLVSWALAALLGYLPDGTGTITADPEGLARAVTSRWDELLSLCDRLDGEHPAMIDTTTIRGILAGGTPEVIDP